MCVCAWVCDSVCASGGQQRASTGSDVKQDHCREEGGLWRDERCVCGGGGRTLRRFLTHSRVCSVSGDGDLEEKYFTADKSVCLRV